MAATLMTGGGRTGRLSARTVGHAHRVLGKALNDALKQKLVTRNRASLISPPTVNDVELANPFGRGGPVTSCTHAGSGDLSQVVYYSGDGHGAGRADGAALVRPRP
jgi:hypothetical protein